MNPSSSMDPSKWFHGYNGSSMDTFVIPWIHSVFYACIHQCIQLLSSCIHGSCIFIFISESFHYGLKGTCFWIPNCQKCPWINLKSPQTHFSNLWNGSRSKFLNGSLDTHCDSMKIQGIVVDPQLLTDPWIHIMTPRNSI